MFKKDYKKFMECQAPSEETVKFLKFKAREGANSCKGQVKAKIFNPFTKKMLTAAACFALIVTMIPMIMQFGAPADDIGRPTLNRPPIVQEPTHDFIFANSHDHIYQLLSTQEHEITLYGSRFVLRSNRGDELLSSSPENDSQLDWSGDAPASNPTTDGDDAGSSTPDFSDTNLQVLGVQEADIVKTDGHFIYAVSDDYINIIAVDNGNLNLLWQIERFNEDDYRMRNSFEIYITNGRLIILSRIRDAISENELYGRLEHWDDWGALGAWGWHNRWWGWGWHNRNEGVVAEIYDISDMSRAPIKIGEYGQSGHYVSSRMIGDVLYLVTNHSQFYEIDSENPATFVPQIFTNGIAGVVPPRDIILNEKIDRVQYTVISGIDTRGGGVISTQAFLGFGQTVYASLDNMFITNTEWVSSGTSSRWWSDTADLRNGPITGYSYTLTHITRIALNNGDVRAMATGTVDGHVLNQFSMDEYNGYFRMVTSQRRDEWRHEIYTGDRSRLRQNSWDGRISDWVWDKEIEEGIFQSTSYESCWNDRNYVIRRQNIEYSSNNLFVLNTALDVVGEVTELAWGERIYSARFMGDVCFFVTFRDIDPLFAADLSNPYNPTILSELKIPGFSDYLHPFGEGRLFGLGRDVDESTGWWGYLKLSMFNTDDLLDVYERHTLHLDGQWWTEASHNHRAILICVNRNIIGFPSSNGTYRIYGYDDENGFFERGVIDFNEGQSYRNWWRSWWGQMRGLYIGDYLYVITNSHIASYCLENFTQVDFVSLTEEVPGNASWYD